MAIVKFNVRAGLLGLVVATCTFSSQQRDAPDVLVADALSLPSRMFDGPEHEVHAHALVPGHEYEIVPGHEYEISLTPKREAFLNEWSSWGPLIKAMRDVSTQIRACNRIVSSCWRPSNETDYDSLMQADREVVLAAVKQN